MGQRRAKNRDKRSDGESRCKTIEDLIQQYRLTAREAEFAKASQGH